MTTKLTTANNAGQRLGVRSLLHAIFSTNPLGALRAGREAARAERAAEAAVKPATEYRHLRGYEGGNACSGVGSAAIATGYRARTHSTRAVR